MVVPIDKAKGEGIMKKLVFSIVFAFLLLLFQPLVFADDECGEGKAWARGLIADCHYRIALCQRDLGRIKSAIKELDIHLGLRGLGCRSIYSLKMVRQKLQHLNVQIAQQ